MHLFTRTKVFHEIEGLSQWRRFFENLRVRNNAQAAAQGEFRHGNSSGIAKSRFQPRLDFAMLIGIHAVRADQNVHIQENHRDSIASTRAAEELRSIPG